MSGRIPEPESPITCGDAGENGSIWLRANPQGVWMVGDDGQGGEIGPWLAPWADVLKHAPTEALFRELVGREVLTAEVAVNPPAQEPAPVNRFETGALTLGLELGQVYGWTVGETVTTYLNHAPQFTRGAPRPLIVGGGHVNLTPEEVETVEAWARANGRPAYWEPAP